MGHYLFLNKERAPPVPFQLFEYDEAQGGGRLHKDSTLTKLKLATVEIWIEGINAFVTVPFASDGMSVTRFLANTKESALLVSGEGGNYAQDPSKASPEVLAGLQRVAEVLANASVDGTYLEVPPDLPTELPSPLRTSIFVRKDYHYVVNCMRIKQGGLKTTMEVDVPQEAVVPSPSANTSPNTSSWSASLAPEMRTNACAAPSASPASTSNTCTNTAIPNTSSWYASLAPETRTNASAAPSASPASTSNTSTAIPVVPCKVFVGNVLTGPPGIGKSAIAPFVLAHLAKHGKTVVYRFFDHRLQEQYCLFDFSCSPPIVDIEYAGTPKRLAGYVRSSKTWLLWDGPPRTKGHGQFDNNGPTFVMSSPNDKNYHEFVKGKGAAVLHMNAVSLAEFLKVAEMYRVHAALAVERYRIFGGVIRPALTKLDETEEALRKSVSGHAARELVNLDLVGVRSKVSHTLVQLRSDERMQPMYLRLASPVVREIVFEKAYKFNHAEMQQLVVGGTGKAGVAGLAGHMFEQHGHLVFPEGGLQVHMRQLQPPPEEPPQKQQHGKRPRVDDSSEEEGEEEDAGDDDEDEQPSHHLAAAAAAPAEGDESADLAQQLRRLGLETGNVPIPKVQRKWDDPTQSMPGLHDVYLQPPTTNNAAWDAYYAHGDKKYILQYTVSDSHGVKQEPIRKLLKHLDLSADGVKLVFVVPALPTALYDNFGWQHWQGVKGRNLTRGRWLKMEQWVMKLPIWGQQRVSGSGEGEATTTAPQLQ